MRSVDLVPPKPRAAPPPTGLFLAVLALTPALAWAHERWIPNTPRFPINRAYFQSMSGEVLLTSLGATLALFGVVLVWYLLVPNLVDALGTSAASASSAQESPLRRVGRYLFRLALDGDVPGPGFARAQRISAFVFTRIPAFVLGLGAYEGWLVMPSYPLGSDPLDLALRWVSAGLALWALIGLGLRALGALFFAVYGYLVLRWGIVSIDAIPVLASAFFYVFAEPKTPGVNASQLLGMRLSLGLGFFLLGLVNKIYLAELFIGVGDQHPELLIGPQALLPGLTRETWAFTTALGEMVFGLLLLLGVLNRITTATLALIFANFVGVFGWAEVVHVYPIAGFVLLFFRGRLGSSLDGVVFRANVRLWRRFRLVSWRLLHTLAVTTVAGGASFGLFFVPLLFTVEALPWLTGTSVPADYRPPPLPPPAASWGKDPGPGQPGAPPHGDHAPRKGGILTMVGDTHVEIVVQPGGTVLLYPSDAVRAPIPVAQARGTVRIQRAGLDRTLTMAPDASGALLASGPPPDLAADYTYALVVRGVAVSTTLRVPAGGTAALREKPGSGPSGVRK
jgi:uncharacterized membrane protein YphA (DoxX/SURF4 family)